MLLILISALLACSTVSQTSCDYELILASSAMGNFNTQAYNPPILNRLFTNLNSIQATILATYQLCFNKVIIDPAAMYPQDKA